MMSERKSIFEEKVSSFLREDIHHGVHYLNNVIWPFTKKGYEELVDIFLQKKEKKFYMAVINYNDSICNYSTLESNGESTIDNVYELATTQTYKEFLEQIESKTFASNDKNCFCTNIVIFDNEWSTICFINQRESYSSLYVTEDYYIDSTWLRVKTNDQEMEYKERQAF